MRFKDGSNKVLIELRVVQFWSEIILVISNRTRAVHWFDFEITHMISDQIALHSVQLGTIINHHTKILQRLQIVLALRARVQFFLVLGKFICAYIVVIPNCTQNHLITYANYICITLPNFHGSSAATAVVQNKCKAHNFKMSRIAVRITHVWLLKLDLLITPKAPSTLCRSNLKTAFSL